MTDLFNGYVSSTQEYIASCYYGTPTQAEIQICLDAIETVAKAIF